MSSESTCSCASDCIAPESYTVTFGFPRSQVLLSWLQSHVEVFQEKHPEVTIELKMSEYNSFREFALEVAQDRAELYDAFFISGIYVGLLSDDYPVALDLSDFMKEKEMELDWADILQPYRKYNGFYNRILQFVPLDDSVSMLYYRSDIFEMFNITHPPRTWHEYNAYAKLLDGVEVDDENSDTGKTTLMGTCTPMLKGCGSSYTLDYLFGPIAQTKGTESGSYLNADNNSVKFQVPMIEAIRLAEEQVKYGNLVGERESFLDCTVTSNMLSGKCAMSYGTPNTFLGTTALQMIAKNISIAPIPGSSLVFDEKEGKLRQCTAELCPLARFDENLGWINFAPSMGLGPVCGGISVYSAPHKQSMAFEFFKDIGVRSFYDAVPYPNETSSFVHPYRVSHLNVSQWIGMGYEKERATQLVSVFESMNEENTNLIPRVGDWSLLTSEFNDRVSEYLNPIEVKDKSDDERISFVNDMVSYVNQYIEGYEGGRDVFFDKYKKSLGIYKDPPQQMYYNGGIVLFVYLMASIIIIISIASAIYVTWYRKDRVIQYFRWKLSVISMVGSIFVAVSMFLMTVDDSWVDQSSCDLACILQRIFARVGINIMMFSIVVKVLSSVLVPINRKESMLFKVRRSFVEHCMRWGFLFTLIPATTVVVTAIFFENTKWVREYIEEPDNHLETLPDVWGFCTNGRSWAVLITSLHLLLVVSFTLIISITLCANSPLRRINSLVLAMCIQLYITSWPVLNFVKGDYTATLMMSTILLFGLSINFVVVPMLPVSILHHRTSKELEDFLAKMKAKMYNDYLEIYKHLDSEITTLKKQQSEMKKNSDVAKFNTNDRSTVGTELCKIESGVELM